MTDDQLHAFNKALTEAQRACAFYPAHEAFRSAFAQFGLAIVPVEPTREMLCAAGGDDVHWAEMLAASPYALKQETK